MGIEWKTLWPFGREDKKTFVINPGSDRKAMDAPAPEGEKSKVHGENPELQMQLRNKELRDFVREKLYVPAHELDAAVESVLGEMAEGEIARFPQMSHDDIAALAAQLVDRRAARLVMDEARRPQNAAENIEQIAADAKTATAKALDDLGYPVEEKAAK